MNICTVFENIYSKDNGHHWPIDQMLERIQKGASKVRVEEIRDTLDKEKADLLKKHLPCVCFSGTFNKRTDAGLIEHSGFIVLDFDDVDDVSLAIPEIIENDFVYACWTSPRGNGVKALIKIADKTKHREHFASLRKLWPMIDKSGVNVSRVCYESYDPNIYINKNAEPYTKLKIEEKVSTKETVKDDGNIFRKLLTWLTNRNDAFVTGERNFFIFKLASACCRFGISYEDALTLITNEYPPTNDFTRKECEAAVKSGYRANKNQAGTAVFEREVLIDQTTRKEIEINPDIYNEEIKPRDVVYGQDVKGQALDIFLDGYASVPNVGIPELDNLFKSRRGELTLLSGIGNYGKSQFKKWYQLLRAIAFGEKYATFPPEDYPIQNFYHELTEILLGCDCTPRNPGRPTMSEYSRAYDFVSAHFFYIHPTDLTPTPNYIKERFLELIIKEKVDGCDIDPFNQMTNDYGKHGGRSDKYLETILADFLRFAQMNDKYFWIVAHPHKMQLGVDKNYPCPNVFDIADGAMWNNKCNNILIYHRPVAQTDPMNPACEFHTKKIKDQKTVGEKGLIEFQFDRRKRRYTFDNTDYMQKIIEETGLTFS